MCVCVNVKYLLPLSDFKETLNFLNKCMKSTHVKFQENSSSGCQVVPCRQAEMTNTVVTFCNFANAQC